MGLFDSILKRFKNRQVDWDELEEMLVASDLGVHLAMRIMDELQDMGRTLKTDDLLDTCRKHIEQILPEDAEMLAPFEGRPRVILVAGVNGTGKTTSSAKLAHYLKRKGHSVMLAAADTFRAAAIEQLDHWAEKLDVPIVKGKYQADPSGLCFDAWESAQNRGIEFLICDTAGRLHTRSNLMEELKKTNRVLARKDPDAPHDRLLVVDATTGSNALAQAREFNAALDLSGLIITKLDGSGKGGMAVAIQDQLQIPPLFIGTGEAAEDFKLFRKQEFVEEMI